LGSAAAQNNPPSGVVSFNQIVAGETGKIGVTKGKPKGYDFCAKKESFDT